MDHDRYAWSPLVQRPPVAWPGGARVALVIMPSLQWFPLDMAPGPFPPVGALDEPYPDYRAYSHRDYGNRVGIFRILHAMPYAHDLNDATLIWQRHQTVEEFGEAVTDAFECSLTGFACSNDS